MVKKDEVALSVPIGTEDADIYQYLPVNATLEDVREAISMVQSRHELERAKQSLLAESKRTEYLSRRKDLYNNKYNSSFPKMLIEHLRTGRSYLTFAAKVEVSPGALKRWEDKYEAFKQAKLIGRALQMATWEDLLIETASGRKKGDFKAISFALKNYFPDEYSDKQDIASAATTIIIDTGIVTSKSKGVDGNVIDISDSLYKVIDREEKDSPPNNKSLSRIDLV